jgi:predicted permease
MKFVATPLIALGLVKLTAWAGFTPSSMLVQVFLLEAAMPVAISASIISNLFELDGELASDLWFYNTLLFCIGPLWAVVWIFHGAT